MCYRTDNALQIPELALSSSDLETVGGPWTCSYIAGPGEGHDDLETVLRTAHLAYKYARWATRLAILVE